MPIRNRPQRLQKIQFRKLKNLENLEISFENKHITGIFGTNGSGTEIDGAPGIKQDHIEKFFILVLTVVFLIWR